MTKSKAWILAIRPKTLFASLGPVLLGLGISFYHLGIIRPLIALLTAFCALFMQIGTNLVNDYYDGIKGIDSDQRLGPERMTQKGFLTPNEVKFGFLFSLAFAFLLGIYLMIQGGIPIIIIGLSSLLFAYAYTGGPFPLSYHGLGEITAFVFFGPVAVWGTYYLQTNSHHDLVLIAGIGPGLISATIMSINNLRDMDSDRLSEKRTLALMLGSTRSRQFTLLLILLSSFVPIICLNLTNKPLLIITTFLPYLFFKTWLSIYRGPIDSSLNNALASAGKYLFLYCLFFSLSLNF